MKKLNKTILGVLVAGLAMPTLTGCIEETVPKNGIVTIDQVQSSATAVEAMVNGLPANTKLVWRANNYHWAYGYPAIMRIRDVMTADYAVVESNYNQFNVWATTEVQGPSYITTQFVWNYYYGSILAANNVISGVDETNATERQLGYLGIGYAYRAANYLDMARMYEFLPNEIFPDGRNEQGNVVTGLTCPIVTEKTTQEEVRNNPRIPHAQMFEFIEKDLNKAEQFIVHSKNNKNNTLPNLAVVYGLKARLYMWNLDYAKAKDYARKAIDASAKRPMTEAQGTSVTDGFNQIDPWMWGVQYDAEDHAVKTGLLNFTSFASNETSFGYAGAGPRNMISKAMYERISDTDWRKKLWKGPNGSSLNAQLQYVDPQFESAIPEYGALKFRPNKGDFREPSVGVSSAVPLMRVEEMYFIEAEAAEHLAPGSGVALLENFMKMYRDPNYTYAGGDAIDEIVFQKRVELWGEGQTFFDIKRLNMSVIRAFADSNFYELCRFNTNGRPCWMNFCMVNLEENDNPAIQGWNNPDPTGKYKPIIQ